MDFNTFQKHNLRSKTAWEEMYGMPFNEIIAEKNWAELGGDNNAMKRFVCVGCGESVNMMVMNFFKFELTKLLCYDCQKKIS